jgi:hypothetical protein
VASGALQYGAVMYSAVPCLHAPYIQSTQATPTLSPTNLSGTAQVRCSEGKNRQVRRVFEALGFPVARLIRTEFGPYKLGDLERVRLKKSTESLRAFLRHGCGGVVQLWWFLLVLTEGASDISSDDMSSGIVSPPCVLFHSRAPLCA